MSSVPAFNRQDASKQTRAFSAKFNVNEYLAERLGEPFREYRRLLESAVRFETEPSFPIHMDFETAWICNLECIMCTHAANAPEELKPKRPYFLDFEVYKKVIDEGARYALRSVGLDQEGEPLMNPRLPEYIRYAREKGVVDVMFNTNATLLTAQKAEMLLGSGLTRIHFSIDAVTEETYKKVRIGGKFPVLMENILHFLKRKRELGLELPVTRVSFVKMSVNEHELDEFVEFWQDKVDYIAVQEYNSPFPADDSYKGLIGGTRDANLDFHCTQPWFRMVVLSDGSVLPCCLLGYSKLLSAGNASSESVHAIWNSGRVRALRRIHKDGEYWRNPVCQMCASNFVPADRLKAAKPDPIHLTFPHLHEKAGVAPGSS